MENLSRNLLSLRENQPELVPFLEKLARSQETETVRNTQGVVVHRYRGKLLHSQRDPVAEAQRWAERCPREELSLFGFGDGYHVEALVRGQKACPSPWIVVEPDGRFLRAVLEDRDLSGLLPRIRLEVGGPPAQAAKALGDPGCGPLLVHPPSGQAHPRYLEALQALRSYGAHSRQALRILVAGPIYGGSYPIARFVERSLRTLGHVVEFVDLSAFHAGYQQLLAWDRGKGLLAALEQVLSSLIESKAEAFAPDLIFALAQTPLREESLQRFQAQGIRVAYWFVEDYRRMTYWQRIAPRTDAFFMIQREGQQEVRGSGAPLVHYLPLAALPAVHGPCDLTADEQKRYGAGLSFVGAGYPNRRNFLSRLHGLDLKIWGNEWDGIGWPLKDCVQEGGRRVEPEEIVKIFNATRINLNIHSSTYHEGIDPHGDFVNPRAFEIAACRAFQLVDRRTLLSELFSEDEIAVYADLEEVKDKVPFYLGCAEARLDLAQRGYARVQQEHTYELRMQEALGVLFQGGLQPRSRGRPTRQWMEEARLPELRSYLSRFAPEEILDLERIVDAIRGKQKLDRLDRVFLTLAAFQEEATCRKS
jgi:spore maturation protein CgeB